MKVAYDHQIFSRAGYGGISKYFIELWSHLSNYEDFALELLTKFSNNENLLENGNRKVQTFFKDVEFKGKARLLKLINDSYSKRQLKNIDFNVFHPTYYNTYFLQHVRSKPVVVTCYDLIHEKFGNQYVALKKDNPEGKRIILEKSNHIIAISQTTKNDIVDHYKINPEKIKVIYLGYSKSENSVPVKLSLPKKYLLFVGIRSGYKNFIFFIESIFHVLKKFPELNLVCAGGGSFCREEITLFHKLDIADRISFQNINSENLSHIYSNAVAFFYPSLYEGFGIPVLEAFGNQCPAVLSNKGSLPEVGQEAALYFDPYNNESLIEAACRVIENSETRETLIKKGAERLQCFSWEKTAEQTYHLYKSVS